MKRKIKRCAIDVLLQSGYTCMYRINDPDIWKLGDLAVVPVCGCNEVGKVTRISCRSDDVRKGLKNVVGKVHILNATYYNDNFNEGF